ncbi:hypothetical protein [Nocardia rhamnosiphila]|nr:hypothetical protein [Nocardia rhamnosiphila]
MAFEIATGPIGPRYSEDMLAGIKEQQELTNYILGEVNSEEDEHPVPLPQRQKRPAELMQPEEDEDDGEEAIYNEAEFAARYFDT